MVSLLNRIALISLFLVPSFATTSIAGKYCPNESDETIVIPELPSNKRVVPISNFDLDSQFKLRMMNGQLVAGPTGQDFSYLAWDFKSKQVVIEVKWVRGRDVFEGAQDIATKKVFFDLSEIGLPDLQPPRNRGDQEEWASDVLDRVRVVIGATKRHTDQVVSRDPVTGENLLPTSRCYLVVEIIR
jgi:hypothetical protein